MFLRTKFVTNSSSTSFIFYGIRFLDQDTERESFDDGETLEDLANRLDRDSNSEIALHHCWEMEYSIVYPKESCLGLSESGVDDLPVQSLIEKFAWDKHQKWNELIKQFCYDQGLPYERPGWRIAIHVER